MTKSDFEKIEQITVDEMKTLDSNDYMVIDIRDEIAFTYGTINGAVNIPQAKLKERMEKALGVDILFN